MIANCYSTNDAEPARRIDEQFSRTGGIVVIWSLRPGLLTYKGGARILLRPAAAVLSLFNFFLLTGPLTDLVKGDGPFSLHVLLSIIVIAFLNLLLSIQVFRKKRTGCGRFLSDFDELEDKMKKARSYESLQKTKIWQKSWAGFYLSVTEPLPSEVSVKDWSKGINRDELIYDDFKEWMKVVWSYWWYKDEKDAEILQK